jgi:hypothetical protein
MEVGVSYLKVVFPKGHKLSWMNNLFITEILPKDIKEEIKNLSDEINERYKDDIIVPMDNRIIPGITTNPDVIRDAATDMYEGFMEMFNRLGVENVGIRCVYTIGDIPEDWIRKVKTTHEIGSFPVMVKLGHFLDYGESGKSSGKLTTESGLYKI